MKLETSKQLYAERLPKGIPIFYQPFYLDVVAEKSWEAITCFENDNVVALMPYGFKTGGYRVVKQPPLAIYQGPYFVQETGLGKEMSVLAEFEKLIKPFDYYNQNWHPTSMNWLPFYWKGYVQSTRYSYVISNSSMEEVRAGYNENVRRNLKKAVNIVEVEICDQFDTLFSVLEKTFARKGLEQPYNKHMFRRLVDECRSRQCCSMLVARDADRKVHAGMFIIWDDQWVYYMAGGVDSDHKNSGAMTLLFDKAIEFAMQSGRSFDFEGSMIQDIEKYFRSFGAVQQQYFVVTKVRSKFLRLRLAMARIHPAFNPL